RHGQRLPFLTCDFACRRWLRVDAGNVRNVQVVGSSPITSTAAKVDPLICAWSPVDRACACPFDYAVGRAPQRRYSNPGSTFRPGCLGTCGKSLLLIPVRHSSDDRCASLSVLLAVLCRYCSVFVEEDH